jgi:hypothetical protein
MDSLDRVPALDLPRACAMLPKAQAFDAQLTRHGGCAQRCADGALQLASSAVRPRECVAPLLVFLKPPPSRGPHHIIFVRRKIYILTHRETGRKRGLTSYILNSPELTLPQFGTPVAMEYS